MIRLAAGKERYDVHGSFRWTCLRWRWALRRGRFLRLRCSDRKVRWFNARQIACMAELTEPDARTVAERSERDGADWESCTKEKT